jgi:hypothetical protein
MGDRGTAGGKRRRIPFRNSERNWGKRGYTDRKFAVIAERISTYVSEKAQLSDSLSIRRSQVRALVGEPISMSCAIARLVSLRRDINNVPILGTFNPQVGHAEQRPHIFRA